VHTEQCTVELHSSGSWVFRTANYSDWLASSGELVENSTKLTCLEIAGYRIKYSTVLEFPELQIRRGRKVQTQVHTVNSNSRTSNSQCRIFSNKNQIIRSFCISGRLAVPINPDKRSSTVQCSIGYPQSRLCVARAANGLSSIHSQTVRDANQLPPGVSQSLLQARTRNLGFPLTEVA